MFPSHDRELIEVAGLVTNSATFNTDFPDVTNKSSEQKWTLLVGEGLQSLDHNAEAFWSNDLGFEALVNRYNAKSIDNYVFGYGDISTDPIFDAFSAAISNFSNATEQNTPVSSTIQFNSSGDFDTQTEYFFAIDANDDDAIDQNDNTAIAKA